MTKPTGKPRGRPPEIRLPPPKVDVLEGRQLTNKQTQFLAEYLRNGRNGVAAYRTVYSPTATTNTAGNCAAKLLKHPLIAPFIEETERRTIAVVDRVLDRYEITKERVLTALARLAMYDARDLFEWDGNTATVKLKSSNEISDEAAFAITGIVQKKGKYGNTVEVKLGDKRAALVDIARLKGWLTDDMPDNPVTVADVERKRALRQQILRELADMAKPQPMVIREDGSEG